MAGIFWNKANTWMNKDTWRAFSSLEYHAVISLRGGRGWPGTKGMPLIGYVEDMVITFYEA